MAANRLDRMRLVLVDTSHPGNIGAVARAMWAMELADLALVRPKRFPSADATARAAGADALLYHARICDSLEEAVADCTWVVGTTARGRHLEQPRFAPREFALRAMGEAVGGRVALVFGREQTGLTNEELDLCQAVACIDTNAAFSSLNVAAAAQIFAYELRLAAGDGTPARAAPAEPAATTAELEGFYAHLEQTLTDIGYHNPQSPKLLMRRLRHLFARARPDRAEINILRGILAAALKAAGRR